jgi:competence protein ComFC
MPIDPIKLNGSWTDGYAMDVHVISSEFLGYNEFDNPEFNTIRSEIGDLVYQLKYKNKRSKVNDIINLIDPFLEQWTVLEDIDVVIPIPPTKKNRPFQPVFEIANTIAQHINKPIIFDLLEKNDSEQLKNLTQEEKNNAISGSIVKHKKFIRKVNILLIDDLYKSGTTLNEVCKILKKDVNVNNIYVLTMTKTKN